MLSWLSSVKVFSLSGFFWYLKSMQKWLVRFRQVSVMQIQFNLISKLRATGCRKTTHSSFVFLSDVWASRVVISATHTHKYPTSSSSSSFISPFGSWDFRGFSRRNFGFYWPFKSQRSEVDYDDDDDEEGLRRCGTRLLVGTCIRWCWWKNHVKMQNRDFLCASVRYIQVQCPRKSQTCILLSSSDSCILLYGSSWYISYVFLEL